MELRRSACDTCRRRRVRCDSTQPCRRCLASGVVCTYGSSLSRASATVYARSLEQQIADLHASLRALHTQASTSSGTLSSPGSSGPQLQRDQPSPEAIDRLLRRGDDYVFERDVGPRVYSAASTLNLLRTIADLTASGVDRIPREPGRAIIATLDTSITIPPPAPLDWLSAMLPPEQSLRDSLALALDEALIGHECVNRDDLWARLPGIINSPSGAMSTANRSLLALVYALLALAEWYRAPVDRVSNGVQDVHVTPKGMSYFRTSLCIVHQERGAYDLDLIRALILQARYLKAVSSFSDSHASLISAASAALHLGLHLNHSKLKAFFTDEELYERRKVFAVIYSMEASLSFALGVPRTLQQADESQTLGLREDELADEGAALIATSPFSPAAESVLAQQVMKIYALIHDEQTTGQIASALAADQTLLAEAELKKWEASLPSLEAASHSRRALLGQVTIRMIHTTAQMLLYSPYLDHLSKDHTDPSHSVTGFERGSTCVQAAMQAVLLVETMQSQNVMCEGYWLTRYLLLWAANILGYFVIHSKSRVTIVESVSAALRARDLLGTLGMASEDAKRLHDILDPAMDVLSTIRS